MGRHIDGKQNAPRRRTAPATGCVLIKAQETPDLYKDLVVRIGGYSDYFVHLSKEMQAEVIMRTEHEI